MSAPNATQRRTDAASRRIDAPAQAIYDAFVDARAIEQWLPPDGMTARVIEFEPREGGRYRIELTYAGDGKGKTSARTDVSKGEFLDLEPGRRIVWTAEFESDDPAFAGTMVMTWSLAPSGGGTDVSITAENVPPGISKADHDKGLKSTLNGLAAFVGSQS